MFLSKMLSSRTRLTAMAGKAWILEARISSASQTAIFRRKIHTAESEKHVPRSIGLNCGQRNFSTGGDKKHTKYSFYKWRQILYSLFGLSGASYLLYKYFKSETALTKVLLSCVPTMHVACQSGENPARQFNIIADVVEQAMPSVVYIFLKTQQNIPFGGMSRVQSSNGSGFIVGSDGLILTNAHVVGNASTVQVKLQDGQVYEGQVEAVDSITDLATIRISARNLPALKLGKSNKLRPGEWVVAMGSPLSLSNTVTAGIISSVHRGSSELGMHGRNMEYIQTDATINFGNSGGPLVNLNGEAIGINTMKVTAGISFAIPSDKASEFLEKADKFSRNVKQRGKTVRNQQRYLGITMLTLTPSILHQIRTYQNQLHDIDKGVLITQIQYGSPAAQAGLKVGDVIIGINGKEVTSSWDIADTVQTDNLITIRFRRGDKMITAKCQLED